MQEAAVTTSSINRILHINCNYLGTPLHQLMVEKLNNRGSHNEVFVPISPKYEIRVEAKEYGHAFTCFSEIDRYFFFIKQRKIMRTLTSNIEVRSFNCIHAYTLFTDGYCAMQLSKTYGIPFIVAVRDTDISLYFNKRKNSNHSEWN